MTLKQIKDWFKSAFPWQENIYIGKIDNQQDKALCFYSDRTPVAKIGTIGGKANRSYNIKHITMLLRWTNNANAADEMARAIYDFLDEKEFRLNDKRVFTVSRYDSPISLGTDDQGVYEYSFDFDFYENKE